MAHTDDIVSEVSFDIGFVCFELIYLGCSVELNKCPSRLQLRLCC